MNLFGYLDVYVFGWLICCNLTCVWEMSPFKVHLFNKLNAFFSKDSPTLYTEEDWLKEMSLGGYGLFGEMLMCVFCYGTWLSAIISSVMCYFLKYPFWMVLVCMFSWPTLNFLVLKKLKET
jgi:hypothetical protein